MSPSSLNKLSSFPLSPHASKAILAAASTCKFLKKVVTTNASPLAVSPMVNATTAALNKDSSSMSSSTSSSTSLSMSSMPSSTPLTPHEDWMMIESTIKLGMTQCPFLSKLTASYNEEDAMAILYSHINSQYDSVEEACPTEGCPAEGCSADTTSPVTPVTVPLLNVASCPFHTAITSLSNHYASPSSSPSLPPRSSPSLSLPQFETVMRMPGIVPMVDPPPTSVNSTHQYNTYFNNIIKNIKDSGRYRVFQSIEREIGKFPTAIYHGGFGATSQPLPCDAVVQASTQRLTEKLTEKIPLKPPSHIVNWCSNDYLGMGQHPTVIDAMKRSLSSPSSNFHDSSSTSSSTLVNSLQSLLASLHDTTSSLVFDSCYIANEAVLSILQVLMGPNTVVFSDASNHASMIAGIKHSNFPSSQRIIFQHNNVQDLENKLKRLPLSTPKLVVFESVYSMDGSVGPIKDIISLCRRYNSLSFIDEVHAVGLYGHQGGGVTDALQLTPATSSLHCDFISGTLGKAFGVVGGYVASSHPLFKNIKTVLYDDHHTQCHLPPSILHGAIASVKHLMTSSIERDIHQQVTMEIKAALLALSLPVMENPSHIVPLFIGDPHRSQQASTLLLSKHHIYVQPINYPTVAAGTERLRVTPSPVHASPVISQSFIKAIDDVWSVLALPRLEDLKDNVLYNKAAMSINVSDLSHHGHHGAKFAA